MDLKLLENIEIKIENIPTFGNEDFSLLDELLEPFEDNAGVILE